MAEKTFVKPWANWTIDDAKLAEDALLGKNRLLEGEPDEVWQAYARNLEGYQAEHKMERTLEKNAPLLSSKGLRRQSRLVFPKANESVDANRPGWVTALEGARDLVTLPQRAGIQIGGDLQNLGRALLGFELVDPESYSMGNAGNVIGNDPVVAMTASPGAFGARALAEFGASGARIGGRTLGKVIGERAGKAAGGFLGEGAALSGMELAGNLGDVSREQALGMGFGGTALGRVGSGAVTVAGKGAQKGAQYLTRKKYNINPSDQKKGDLLRREFGGEKLPKENELLLLESGELGRDPIAAEAVAGEGSAWAQRTGEKYEQAAAGQNARLENALAFRPHVEQGAGAPAAGREVSARNTSVAVRPEARGLAVRPDNPVSIVEENPLITLNAKRGGASAEGVGDLKSEFRRSLEAAGISPDYILVRDGETTQVALAREMNRRDAYIKQAGKAIEGEETRLADMRTRHAKMREELVKRRRLLEENANEFDAAGLKGEKREKAARALDKEAAEIETLAGTIDQLEVSMRSVGERIRRLTAERNRLASHLDRAAEIADELDLGIVSVDRLAKETLGNIEGEVRFSNDLSSTGFGGAQKRAVELVDDFEKTARLKEWNRDQLGNPNGSGRFIPSGKLRGMVSGITKRQMRGASTDPGLLDDTKTAAMNFRKAKNKIDQKQSQGELGETASQESLRHAIFEGLWNKQPTVDNANRMTIGNLAGFVNRSPYYDKGLTKLYQFGTSLVRRTPEQQVARRALGLEEVPGGELGTLFRNVLSTTGRELPHLSQIGKTGPTQRAFDQIDAFVANLNNQRRSQK